MAAAAEHAEIPPPGALDAGQRRLLDAKVLVVGAGGLGAPALMYLAAAGIGTIGIVDDDIVSLSNLQRQVIFSTGEIIYGAKEPSYYAQIDGLDDALNPDSLQKVTGYLEPAMAARSAGERYQFERQGYFWADPKDSKPGALVFNRIISLKDSWAKAQPAAAPAPAAKKPEPVKAEPATPSVLSLSPAAEALAKRLGVAPTVARVLDEDAAALAFVEAAVVEGAAPAAAANTVVNDLLPAARGAALTTLSLTPAGLAALVNLVTKGEISSKQAKEVLAECLTSGESPAEVVKRLGLSQLSDDASLKPLVEAVLAEHQDKLIELRAGNVRLLGFLVGQVLKRSGGRANPSRVQALVEEAAARA
jgi:glutaminyl-tRNA synthetase